MLGLKWLILLWLTVVVVFTYAQRMYLWFNVMVPRLEKAGHDTWGWLPFKDKRILSIYADLCRQHGYPLRDLRRYTASMVLEIVLWLAWIAIFFFVPHEF